MWKKWLQSNWRRLFILIICFAFVLDRQLWHKLQFDAVTIWLVVVIVLFLFFPNPQIIFPYVKRIKLWEVEIELKEQIRELEKEVVKAQDASTSEAIPGTPGKIPSEVEVVLSEAGKNPRAALLLLSTQIEREVKERLREAGVTLSRRNATASQAVEAGVKAGIFTREFSSAFRDFWTVRNRIVHGEAFDVNDNTILSLISLGTELLKVISTEKITEIDVLCRDGSDDPVVVEVFIQEPRGVVLQQDEVVEALGFSFIPGKTLLSEIMAHGWVKKEKEPIPDYHGSGLPAWKLIRGRLNTNDKSQ